MKNEHESPKTNLKKLLIKIKVIYLHSKTLNTSNVSTREFLLFKLNKSGQWNPAAFKSSFLQEGKKKSDGARPKATAKLQ